MLGPIIAFYLLVDLPHIRRVFRSLVPERARGDSMVLARRLSTAIGGYFRGQLAVAFIVGVMASIGMLHHRPAVLADRRHDRRAVQHDPADRPVGRRRARHRHRPHHRRRDRARRSRSPS